MYKVFGTCLLTMQVLFMGLGSYQTSMSQNKAYRGASFATTENYINMADFNSENNSPHIAKIIVSGLPNVADKSYGLERVQLTIIHNRVSDIKVELESPQGRVVWLTNRHGRNGANYTETVFTQTGFRGAIANGEPPFVGEFLPDGRLSNFNNGQNPNGEWKVKVYDLAEGVSGKFGSTILFFSSKPAIDNFSICSINNFKECKCKKGKKNGELLPDLTLIKSLTERENLEIAYNKEKGFGELRFGVSTFNKGFGPLEVFGSGVWRCNNQEVGKQEKCPDGSYPRQEVYQKIYIKTDSGFTYRIKPAGFNAYDSRPGHEHYHSDDYVLYELLKVDTIDPRNIKKCKTICQGTKASFCIWDLGFCRDDLNNCVDVTGKIYNIKDMPNYGFKGYSDCSAELQGLSVGGVDYYGENFEGQVIYLPKEIKNGEYLLRIMIDPNNLFEESDETNNEFFVPIQLKKQTP